MKVFLGKLRAKLPDLDQVKLWTMAVLVAAMPASLTYSLGLPGLLLALAALGAGFVWILGICSTRWCDQQDSINQLRFELWALQQTLCDQENRRIDEVFKALPDPNKKKVVGKKKSKSKKK